MKPDSFRILFSDNEIRVISAFGWFELISKLDVIGKPVICIIKEEKLSV